MPNLFRMLMDPLTDLPTRAARTIGSSFDPATGGEGGDRGYVKPFMAGALEGAGDLASQSTSPASLLMMAAGISPSIGRIARTGKLMRAVKGTDRPLRTLTADTAAWKPPDPWKSLANKRIEERLMGYDVPNNPRAQELERVRKIIEEEYLKGMHR